VSREGIVSLRVRYTEVDRMGVAHHRNHFVWFEIGRTELMRAAGVPYAAVEDEGVYLPVIEASCAYKAPARYDDVLSLSTAIAAFSGARVTFAYRLVREADGALIATGTTTHAAIDPHGRPRRFPEKLRRMLS
jgi:acyl-CoA thioester hydrolase